MEHVLDNPAWSALTSGSGHLANGSQQVKYFDKEVSPFVGFKTNTADSFHELYTLLPHDGPVVFISPVETVIPLQWRVLNAIKCFQMIYDSPAEIAGMAAGLVSLTTEHVPQMLALTQLTNPGPFANRTIEFGHYYGIFDGDKLVAMAGQRLPVFNYTEISAVCTHPDYLGRGYARRLLLFQAQRIKAAAGIPFLHVRNDNERAVNVYRSLGFATRKELYFYILQKSN